MNWAADQKHLSAIGKAKKPKPINIAVWQKAVTKSAKPKVAEAIPFYKKHPFELVAVLFTLLLFSNSLFNDYNLDDKLVTRNHRLTAKGIFAIPEIFTSPYYQDAKGYAY